MVLTDLYRYYQEPEIVRPVQVDDINLGVPSDHAGVVVVPKCLNNISSLKTARKIRPIPDSSLNKIGQILTQEQWSFLKPDLSASPMTDLFEDFTTELVDTVRPVRTVYVRPYESPFVTEKGKL